MPNCCVFFFISLHCIHSQIEYNQKFLRFFILIWLTFASRFQIFCAHLFSRIWPKFAERLIFAKINPIKVSDPLFSINFFILWPRQYLPTFIWSQIFLGIHRLLFDFIYISVTRLIKFKMKCLNSECYSEYHLCWNEIERLLLILSRVQVLNLHLCTLKTEVFAVRNFCHF